MKDRQAFVSDARKLHVQFLAARTDALAAFYRDALAEGVDGTEHLRVAIRSGWYERECLRFYNAVPKMKYDVEVQAAFDVLGVASPECEEFVAERLEVYAGTFAEARQAEAARIAERERAAGCPVASIVLLGAGEDRGPGVYVDIRFGASPTVPRSAAHCQSCGMLNTCAHAPGCPNEQPSLWACNRCSGNVAWVGGSLQCQRCAKYFPVPGACLANDVSLNNLAAKEDFVIALTERLRMGIHDLAARAGLTICEPEPGSTFAQYVGPYDRQRRKIVPVGVYAGVAPAVLNFLEQDLLAFLSEIRKTSSRIAFGQNPIYAEHCSDGIVWKLRCAFSGLP